MRVQLVLVHPAQSSAAVSPRVGSMRMSSGPSARNENPRSAPIELRRRHAQVDQEAVDRHRAQLLQHRARLREAAREPASRDRRTAPARRARSASASRSRSSPMSRPSGADGRGWRARARPARPSRRSNRPARRAGPARPDHLVQQDRQTWPWLSDANWQFPSGKSRRSHEAAIHSLLASDACLSSFRPGNIPHDFNGIRWRNPGSRGRCALRRRNVMRTHRRRSRP